MGTVMLDDLKNYFAQRNEQILRDNLQAERAASYIQDDYFEHNMRVMKNRHARLLFSTRMLVMVLIVSAIQFLFQDIRFLFNLEWAQWFSLTYSFLILAMVFVFVAEFILILVHQLVNSFPLSWQNQCHDKTWFWLPWVLLDGMARQLLTVSVCVGCAAAILIYYNFSV